MLSQTEDCEVCRSQKTRKGSLISSPHFVRRARVELIDSYLERGSRHHLIGDSTKSLEGALAAILLITNIVGDENEQVW